MKKKKKKKSQRKKYFKNENEISYVSSSIKTDILYIADVLYDDNQKQYMAENRDQPSLWGFSFYHSLCIA